MAENPLESHIDEISDDIFAELLDTVPASTAGVSDVLGATKPKEDKPKENKPEPKPDETPAKTQEQIDAELEEITDPKGKPQETPKDNTELPADTTAAILKAKAAGLIERGIWKEFEGIENFEWTDDNYGELATVQAQWKAEELFNEMLDQSGDYGKTIMNHIKNGGDPAEIISLFKEAKRVNNLDISEEPGQQSIIREYYTKVHGWSEAKTTRFINAAIDNKALKDEATEIKTLLENEIKAEAKARENAAAESLRERQELEKNWASTITNAIKTRDDLSDKDKRELQQNLLTYNQKLPDGRVVNQFTMNFMKLQADPQKFVELARFVNDPEKYTKGVEKKADKEAAKKTWEFVKGNGAVSKGGASHTKQDSTPGSDFKIDWKSAYK